MEGSFPGGSVVKNLLAKRLRFDPWKKEDGRSPGEGNGNPLQHSCLGNSMDREAGWATVIGSQELEQLRD